MLDSFKFFFRMWHLSHPVGCPGYVKPTNPNVNDSAPTTCKKLTLDKV